MSELQLPWDSIFMSAWEVAKNSVGKVFGSAWQHQQWKQAATIYRERIMDWYGTTRILGKSDPIELDHIFTDVLIWDKPQSVRHISAETLQELFLQNQSHKELERLDGIEVLERFPRLLLLGKPGAGKTTFLKWIALRCADEYLNGIPIFISLKEMGDAKRTIWEQILFQFAICQFPNGEPFVKALLTSGQAVVLLDGLDEVSGEQGTQDKVIDDIRDFVRAYGKNRIVVTCRVAAVSYAFEGFKYVEMAEFTEEQIRSYVTKYFDPDEDMAVACLKELLNSENQRLLDMAGSPLLLSLICLNYEETLAFPARRVDLYEEALRALLVRWDSARRIKRDTYEIYKKLPLGQKPHLYAHLAYVNFLRGQYFIQSKKLEEQTEAYLRTVPSFDEQEIDGELVLRTMEAQHGIIVERAKNVHSFSHLTFQEYYTAKYIVDNQVSGTLTELVSHIVSLRWREVFLLTSSLLSQADTFFHLFLREIQKYATSSQALMKILIHASANTSKYTSLTSVEARSWKISCFLNDTFTRNSVYRNPQSPRSSFARSKAFAVNRILSPTQEVDYTRYIIRTQKLGHARVIRKDLNHALELDLIEPAMRLDILCLTIRKTIIFPTVLEQFMSLTTQVAFELGLAEFGAALVALELPQKNNHNGDNPEWETFRHTFEALVLKHWGLQLNFEISEMDFNVIDLYLTSVLLFLQCFKIASVSDRQRIRDLLLLTQNPQ